MHEFDQGVVNLSLVLDRQDLAEQAVPISGRSQLFITEQLCELAVSFDRQLHDSADKALKIHIWYDVAFKLGL
jgi:hypothetical protein